MELTAVLVLSAGVLALLYWRKQRADRLAGLPKILWQRKGKSDWMLGEGNWMKLLEYPDGRRIYQVRRRQDIICSHCGEWLVLRRTYTVPFQEGVDPIEQLKGHTEKVAFDCLRCGKADKRIPQLTPSEWLQGRRSWWRLS